MRPHRLALFLIALTASAVLSVTAQAEPAPPGLPSVLCKAHQSAPGEGKTTVPGVYSYRPHNCLLHKYQLSQPAFQLYGQIRWAYWNAEEAYGFGGVPGIEVGAWEPGGRRYFSPVTVRLVAPVSVCGRVIFTAASFHFLEIGERYEEQVDRLPVPGTSC